MGAAFKGESLREVSLDDKYTADKGHVLLSGVQALVRLPLMQKQADRQRGWNTAGYISGYRGSPLGTYDDQLAKASKLLRAHDIVFQPGVNEDLAATAVWGSQQAQALGEGKFDGVFSVWYGKGPGVDRSGDAFRHANLAGTADKGGVLLLMGDDHTCESSTTCHQSEFALVDAMIPVLSPAGVQEVLHFGLAGWAMSRYSGLWVGLKCVKDVADATAVVDLGGMPALSEPDKSAFPADGLNLRQPDTPHAQEFRLHNFKLDAARKFCRENKLDRTVVNPQAAWLGIATHGKSYLDVMQALDDLGLSSRDLHDFGVRLCKVGMVWPLETTHALAFAEGLEKIMVVEEKRSLVESQLREALYGLQARPQIVGKKDEAGGKLFQAELALDSVQIAIAIGKRLLERFDDGRLRERLARLESRRAPLGVVDIMQRSFYFCSGCPHNTSTVIPDGSRAYAGIGCSWMAQSMGRSTMGYTQMGAEGMSWVGEAPFSKRGHVFQNIGDGTYFHSGLLSIRAAVAAKTNITFKVLFNDAVAMTGGQRHDGPLTPQTISWQVFAEGVSRIAVVTDDPQKYRNGAAQAVADLSALPEALRANEALSGFAPGVTIAHRDTLDAVQKMLREIPGTTVLIYDQTCAAEKRRRRKRGTMVDPAKRLFINDLVCEGCGDCGVQSNCVSLQPLETEFGRKRTIDQSSCNKDYSCVKGFCPSFVTVKGGTYKPGAKAGNVAGMPDAPVPEPVLPAVDGTYSLIVTGVGGTGVVTIGAILGMAAHLEGKGCGMLDMAGLAQKGGSVWSHLRIAPRPEDVKAIRVGPGGADAVVGCDLIVTAGARTLALMNRATRVAVNIHQAMPGQFAQNPDMQFAGDPLFRNIGRTVGAGNVFPVQATEFATAHLGDAIGANMFMLGFAYQNGLIPISAGAILRAIELNGASVAMNQRAFAMGRAVASDPSAVAAREEAPATETLEEMVERRSGFLADYQGRAYAKRYTDLVASTRAFETARAPGSTALTEAVARYFFKLLAVKDEYEVARLYSDTSFLADIRKNFEGPVSLEFNLAPPIFAKTDDKGIARKMAFGGWMRHAFFLLARLRRIRGTPLDIFGYTAERRQERELIAR
ncbi:MAG: indolepyruvate ferredoxin oxidoreductase family protein, partial [Pseudomonadota bacterium]